MIKAIIFDANGPLYYRGEDAAKQKRALVQEFHLSAPFEKFEAAYKTEKFKAYTQAKTVEKMFQDIFSSMGSSLSDEQAVRFSEKFGRIQAQVTPVPDAIPTLKLLKKQGYKLCVLTDSFYSAKDKWAWFEQLGMKDLLDHMISSYDIRALKDTPEAYQAYLGTMRIHADEAVFVGHQEYEMVGARKSGIKSVAVLPISPADIHADYTIKSLSELPELLRTL